MEVFGRGLFLNSVTGKSYIAAAQAGSGSGDMLKDVYDTNDDGIVNTAHNAQQLNGQPANFYATAAALASKADLVDGLIPPSQLPPIALVEFLGSVASQSAMLALTGQPGDWCIRADELRAYFLIASDPTQLSSWQAIVTPASPVLSVNGYTGPVVLTKSDIALSNVDNTSDLNKPVSTATGTALGLKLDASNYAELIDAELSVNTVVTVTGGTAPSGTTNHRINYVRMGRMVQASIYLNFGTAGSSNSNFTISNLEQLPAPLFPTGWTNASTWLARIFGLVQNSQTAVGTQIVPLIRRNAAGNGWEIANSAPFTSTNARYISITFSYIA